MADLSKVSLIIIIPMILIIGWVLTTSFSHTTNDVRYAYAYTTLSNSTQQEFNSTLNASYNFSIDSFSQLINGLTAPSNHYLSLFQTRIQPQKPLQYG